MPSAFSMSLQTQRIKKELKSIVLCGNEKEMFHALNWLLHNKRYIIHIPDKNGETALHWAAYLGDFDLLLSLCLHFKMNPFIPNNYGQTPLDIAAEQLQLNKKNYNYVRSIQYLELFHQCIQPSTDTYIDLEILDATYYQQPSNPCATYNQ